MKSAVGLATSVLLEAALPVVRTIALARLLPQDQFGIAITVLATIGIVEMCCDVGFPQSAIRGSTTVPMRSYIGTLHTLSSARAVVMMLLVVAILGLQQMTLDSSFGPDLFVLAALILGLRAFENLTMKQLSRQYDFWREAVLMSGAQIVWTSVTIASALISPSYASMFHGMLAASLWIAVYSNLVVADRWQASWNTDAARDALKFGAPLIPNGIASAIGSTDRLVISNFLGTRQVAIYGVAISLATLPRAVLWKFSLSMLVPHFANLMATPEKELKFYGRWMLFVSVIASLYGIALITLGPWVVQVAFGPAYVPPDLLMALIAVNVFIKLMMLVPVPAAFARGQTSIVFLGSMVSAVAAVPACLTLVFGMRSLETFVLALNIFEGIGLVWFLLHTSRQHGLRQPIALTAIVAPILALGSLTAAAWARG